MSNNTEALIAEMKAAAEKAIQADELFSERKITISEVVIEIKKYLDYSDNPKNILALIAELEQAKKQNKELQIKIEATEAVALALRDELRTKGEHIAELEANQLTAEHQRVIGLLLGVCGTAFELADDGYECELDGEQCITVPVDSFERLSDSLNEIENTLPYEYDDLPGIILQWGAIPRHALKGVMQVNSPVEASKLAVKLPDLEKWRSVDAVRAQAAYRVLCGNNIRAAGGTVQGDE